MNDLTVYENIYRTFIKDDRYMFFLIGLRNTIILSLLAMLIGIIIGIVMCLFKLSKFKPLNWIAYVYIDVIRGTPSVTQLLIVYFVIFNGSPLNKLVIAAIAFGINSGAYVAEIMRAGILSIDHGQTEAGRSIGLTHAQTLRYIVVPQAIKNILPALVNEFVVLIKETAIAGYAAIDDLTKLAMGIQSRTFDVAYPLIGSAILYYIIIKLLTISLSALEKRLRKSDIRTAEART